MTPNIVEGVIRGKTIELQADPGFGDGQKVSIAFNSPAQPDARIEAILRTAGAMADDPEFEAIMDQIQRDRGSAPDRPSAE